MKFNKGKLKAVGAILACVYAAIEAYSATRERQLQADAIEELEQKVAELEGKKES